MGIFSRRKEQKKEDPEAQVDEAKKAQEERAATEQKIDQALNNPKFTQFLEKYGDSIENIGVTAEDSQELLGRYEVFEKVGKVASDIKKVLQSEILQDTKIRMSNEDLECIDAYLEDEVSKASIPEGLDKLHDIENVVHDFEASKKLLAQREQLTQEAIAKKQGEIDKQTDVISRLKSTDAFSKFSNKFLFNLGVSAQNKATFSQAKELGIDFKNISEREEKLTEEAKNLDELVELQKVFSATRISLLDDLSAATGLKELVDKAVSDKLMGAVEDADGNARQDATIDELDRAQAYRDNLHDRYTSEVPDYFQAALDKLLQERIAREAKDAVGSVETNRSNQANTLEKKLQSLFDRRTDGMGSMRTKDEIKDFVGRVLGEIYDLPATDQIKRLLLRRVCAKNDVNIEQYRRGANSKSEPMFPPETETTEQEEDETEDPDEEEEKTETTEGQKPEGWLDLNEAYAESNEHARRAQKDRKGNPTRDRYQKISDQMDAKKARDTAEEDLKSENRLDSDEAYAEANELARRAQEDKEGNPARDRYQEISDQIDAEKARYAERNTQGTAKTGEDAEQEATE